MKKQRKVFVFMMLFLVLVTTAVSLKDVIAVTTRGYKTTIVDSNGLEIDVATVRSNEVIETEDYIKANLNETYAKNNKLIPTDIIMVKNLIAEESKLPEEKTIDAMWEEAEEAFIMLNDTYVLLYDTDDESDYYVAYVDTMHDDATCMVTDISFAYTNLNGEVISDAIYDYETGLAYVPKKYTQENKNGIGVCNVQIELLQAVNSENPTTSFNVVVEKDEDISGKFTTDGIVTVEAINTKFGIRVALDSEAKESITGNYFKVLVNDSEINEWEYYDNEGILVIENMPSVIETLKISISQENVDANVEKMMQNGGISSYAINFDQAKEYESAGEWKIDALPTKGSLITIKGGEFIDVWYEDDPYGSEHGNYIHESQLPLYYEVTSGNPWTTLINKIMNGGSVNANQLGANTTWIQYTVTIKKDLTVTDTNNVSYQIGAGNWVLKCVHNASTFSTEWWKDSNGKDHSAELRMRVFEVTDDYILVGMLTAETQTQTGSGLYKIKYAIENGNLEVGKKDSYGDYVAGATLRITGPNGFDQTIVTKAGEATLFEGVNSGEYTIQEIGAPTNMVINSTPKTVTVIAGQTVTGTIENTYQRGSVRLTKYDADNRGNTLGDATLEGAKFNLCAAEDIYEGRHLIYAANQVIRSGITTAADGSTEAITNLPIGNYYYIETKPSEGFNINTNKIPVEIVYAGQNAATAAEAYNEVPEKPIYGNVKITKKLGATDYDPEILLSGVQFELTLVSDNTQKYLSNISGNDGICQFNNIPYGEYICKEVVLNDMGYAVEDFNVTITEEGKTYTYEKIDLPKQMQIEAEKILLDETVGKTDAKKSGAYFTVYTDAECTEEYVDKNGNVVIIGPTNENGYAISKKMRTKTYYLKETTFPEGIDPDAKIPGEDVTYREKIYVAQASNKEQGSDEIIVKISQIVNKPKMASIEVIKYDNQLGETEEISAEGAILRLTLDSNPDCYYDAVINENGYAEFVNEDLRAEYYPYTIPYGEYTITEVKESNSKEHTNFFIQPEKVIIKRQEQKEYRILADEPVEMFLEIQKTDKDTNEKVNLAGAKFKVWNCATNEWVSQIIYPSGEYIDEFETGENGHLTLPHKIEAGEYIIYETEAPEGYYLEDAWRIPEKEADLGNAEKGGKLIVINKAAMNVVENTPANKVDLYYEVEMPNTPLKGKLEIFKTGEVLTDASINTTEYGDKYTPMYAMKGLKGVTYDIRAAEDIKSPDGTIIYVAKGTKVDTITTGEDGYAMTKELYLGEYEIVEVAVPEGYLIDKEIKNVTLENEDTLTRIEITNKKLTNIRQKLSLSFPKEYTEVNFVNGKDSEKFSVFGVYANQDIKNVYGNIVIGKNDLVDIIKIEGEEDNAMSTIDLPEGKYYIKELDASYPYSLSEEIIQVELTYQGNEHEHITQRANGFTNTYDSSTLTLIKISTSSLKELVLIGDKMDTTKLDEQVAQILEDIKGMTEAEVEKYLEANDIKFIAGAKYKIYTDKECQNPLYIKSGEEFVEAELVTSTTGMIKLENIPLGKYFVKEVEAPKGYELADTLLEVDLTLENKDQMVYKPLVEYAVKTPLLTKTDIFTGEVIPNCTFEIKDKDGKVLLHSITNEEGVGYIPVDLFKDEEVYTYTEIEAPEIYDLNTEPHEFVADFNEEGEWVTERIKVDNRRKTIEQLVVRKVDDETGEPLQGCKFSIILVDAITGEPVLDPNGENVYLVKEAVTDETGEYIVEKPYYGTYQFIEVEAPEGYELKVDMEGMEFTIDENSPETVIFEVTNTGDIAVYALSAMAVISVLGIAYVVVKNKKQRV